MLRNIILLNAILTLGNILIKFGLNIFLAGEFPEKELVIYFTLIDIITLLSMIVSGFKDALVRAIARHKEKAYCYFKNIVGLFFIVIFVFVIPLITYFNYGLNLPIKYQLWELETTASLLIINAMLGQFLLANCVYMIVSYIEIMRGVFFVAIFFLAYLIFNFNSADDYLLTAFIASNLLILFWLLYNIKNYIITANIKNFSKQLRTDSLSKQDKKEINRSVTYASLEYFTASISLYSSSLIMLYLFGDENVGDFQVVARPIYFALIAVFSYPIFRFLFPEFSTLIKNKQYTRLAEIRKKFNLYLSIFSVVLIMGCWLFAEFFVLLLFPEGYKESYRYLNILIIAIPFVVYTSFLFSVIKAAGYFKQTFYIRLVGFMAFLVSLSLFVSMGSGAIAIIYAILVSVLVMFVNAYVVEKRIKKYEI
jgi:O-antigen/teichoic acid export membrane protein